MSEQIALPVDPPDQVEVLRARLGTDWPSIVAARTNAREKLRVARTQLYHLVPPETTLVFFGSLARLELTSKSDADWTLLVDGFADPDHWERAARIEARLRELELRPPTEGGAFGDLTFSHDLIHNIGGEYDTNRNTTQRLLLLLESVPIGNPDAYDRVVRKVLERYIEEDLVGPGDTPYRVPRFLQNDFARYWRTMAVDFAHKRWMRAADKWALRTAKLRMSRKLLYAAGLLTSFSCELAFPDERRVRSLAASQHVIDHLVRLVHTTPLDIAAGVVLQYFGKLSGPAKELFGAYDEFLAMLDDTGTREHLEALTPTLAHSDPVYQRVRDVGTRFQDALTAIFFTCDTPLRALTTRYGVF